MLIEGVNMEVVSVQFENVGKLYDFTNPNNIQVKKMIEL